MKVLLEITDANTIEFISGRSYPVLHNFKNDECLGVAEITRENGKLYAYLETNINAGNLFPAVGYKAIKWLDNGNLGKGELFAVGLSENPNEDNRIPKVKFNEQS